MTDPIQQEIRELDQQIRERDDALLKKAFAEERRWRESIEARLARIEKILDLEPPEQN